jgi:Ca-activated chloride channel family protein
MKLRYKEPDGNASKLMEFPVMDSGTPFAEATGDYRFASAVAAFGMVLRESPYQGQLNLDDVLQIAEKGRGLDAGGYREEFIHLVRKAQSFKNPLDARVRDNGNLP